MDVPGGPASANNSSDFVSIAIPAFLRDPANYWKGAQTVQVSSQPLIDTI